MTFSLRPPLFNYSSHYLISLESQIGADSKARNLARSDQLLNLGSWNVKHLADFFYCQDLVIATLRAFDKVHDHSLP
jgi:hypothetical protein